FETAPRGRLTKYRTTRSLLASSKPAEGTNLISTSFLRTTHFLLPPADSKECLKLQQRRGFAIFPRKHLIRPQ
ncbi:unnamed protein product, partial [Ixodes pacificus]